MPQPPLEQDIRDIQERSLVNQVRDAQIWLPLAIVGVVVVHQFWVVPVGGARWQFWSQLLFYGLVGPVVTYVTLRWVVQQAEARERDQQELEYLYRKLQGSHALLSAMQQVTERFASSEDLESILDVAAQGITEVTGAQGTAIIISSGIASAERFFGLHDAIKQDARVRAQLLEQRPPALNHKLSAEGYYVLTYPLRWGGRLEGSLHSYYHMSPSAEQRESFAILVSEFSAAAEAVRGRIRDLLTLFEVDRTIRAEGNLETLLETLLEQMMARVDATVAGVYLLDDEPVRDTVEEQLEPTAAREAVTLLQLHAFRHHEFAEIDLCESLTLRLGEGIVGRVATAAQPEVIAALSPEEQQLCGALFLGMQSAICLPLQTEAEILGVVLLAHPDTEHFQRSNLPFLTLVAGQVSLAVRNAQAYLQSEELAIAEERARIAREIHDGVAQSLAFSALKLDLASRKADEPHEVTSILREVKETLRETIRELRRSIFALRPVDLERYGLVETIRRYVEDFGEQNGIGVDLHIAEDIPSVSAKSEAVIYRIFQEAMHNVAKHARAQYVRVKLEPNSHSLTLSIEDDGIGFDPQQISGRVTSAGGLGLRQMHERLEARGGDLRIEAAPTQGTRLVASLPY